MDPRFRPVSIEICVSVGLFLILFEGKIISTDLTSPLTLIVLFVFVLEFIRILYELRKLRKEGVDISSQGWRNPLVDSVDPKVGDAYAKAAKGRMYITFAIVAVCLILHYVFHIDPPTN